MKNETELKINTVPQKQVSKFCLKKTTHLYLHDKYLKKIPKIADIENVSVLYLHNNEISQIENIYNAANLTSLYLQKNRILKIEGLSDAKKLKRLYLGHNTISVVEGLENLKELEELHIEKQYLMEGSSLCFDPRSLMKISDTIRVLNISHNKIQSITFLTVLRHLVVLDASHNDLQDLREVWEAMQKWYYLRNASFAGNPISKQRLYKEDIIANAYCLEMFDQKSVSPITRNFLKRLFKEKCANNLKKKVNLSDHFADLPRNYPISVQQAVSASLLQDMRGGNGDIFDETNAVYIPWRALPKPPPIMTVPITLKTQQKKLNSSGKRTINVTDKFSNIKI